MPSSSRFSLSAIAVAAIATAALILPAEPTIRPALAKDKGQFEEHYESVPADGDPSMAPQPDTGLDPDPAPAPRARPRGDGSRQIRPEIEAPRDVKRRPQPRDGEENPSRAQARKPAEPREDAEKGKQTETREQTRKREDAGNRNEASEAAPRRHDRAAREPVRPRAEPPAPQTAGPAHEEREYLDGEEIADNAFFFDALRENGKWSEHPRYGAVWQPEVRDSWRPFTLGRWAFSDAFGWTWISDEPFGWAVYHYGRWAHEDDYGWFWLPGTEWSPGWVVWRFNDETVGWAPLPLETRIEAGRIFTNPTLLDSRRYERQWVFTGIRHFGRTDQAKYQRSASWNSDLMARTQLRVTYGRDGGHVVNRGIDPDEIVRLAGRPVRKAKVAFSDDPRVRGKYRFEMREELQEDEVRLFRPHRDDSERIGREAVRPGLDPLAKLRKAPRPPREPDVSVEPLRKPANSRTAGEPAPAKPGLGEAKPPAGPVSVDATLDDDDLAETKAPSAESPQRTGRAKALPADAAGAPGRQVKSTSAPVKETYGKPPKAKPGSAAAASGDAPAEAEPGQKKHWDGSGRSGAPAIGPTGTDPGSFN